MIRSTRFTALSGLFALLGGIAPLGQGPRPIYEWRLSEDAVTGNAVRAAVGGLHGRVSGEVRRGANPPHIDFAGSGYIELAARGEPVKLPTRDITAEAWVNLRTTGPWGGFVGYIQDNGSFEHGWVLGYRDARFSFALSSEGATDGDGVMTYLQSAEDAPLYEWCHVAGTYDGRELRVYVNGEPSSSTDRQSGDILYADSHFVIGVYRDDDEHYPLDGAIHSVRIYDRALTADEVAQRYESTRELFADADPLPPTAQDALDPILIDGPRVAFEDHSDAIVRWDTREPRPSIIEFGELDAEKRVVADKRPKRSHAIRLHDLRRNTEYAYRLRLGRRPSDPATREYTLDTEFDFSVPPLPSGESPYPRDRLTSAFTRAAQYIIEGSRIDRGYCIDYGCGDGRLAYEIARRSQLRVVGVSTDREAIERGRKVLVEKGIYGSRVTLRHVESLDRLPFPDMCANLIVSSEAISQGSAPGTSAEVARKLRPAGGTAYLGQPRVSDASLAERRLADWLRDPGIEEGIDVRVEGDSNGVWAIIERPEPLAGAGEWTHAYGTAGQTANSGDELVVGKAGETLEVQWFGLPGPNAMLDRQVRMQGPVSAAGRLFT